ncbi:hypothetical protein [Halolactibacillus sp. JCM 19043]|uniref:hypothetical protein n=1 Tax=Halolactibacillus sp. JCM 19043 TaxID=1460638 RepID=UPI000781CF0A|nr:hypothetical protein [Halolactibacillus sp. JCM 19043]
MAFIDLMIEEVPVFYLVVFFIFFLLMILMLRKLRQLTDYKCIVIINTINQTYQTILTTPITVIDDQASKTSLQHYLLDRQPVIYHGKIADDDLVIDKEQRQYTLPKPLLEQFFYVLSQVKTMMVRKRHSHRQLSLMIETQDPLLFLSLLDKNQWNEYERLFTNKQLMPVVYLAIKQVNDAWDDLSVTDRLYVRNILKDYGRSGMEKLAVYLTRRERRQLVRLEKRLRNH